MDSSYHIFKKSTKSKGKTVHKWYCYWNDPVTGVMHQKVCKGCKTQAEAYAFVSALPPLIVEEKITIAKIAEWMYIPGGPHMDRLNKLGRLYTVETIRAKRYLLTLFLEKFGDLELQDLTIPMVIDYLAVDKHSGSWKNKIAGHTSLAMTDHYTRAVIPDMVKAVKPAAEAANRLFK